MSDEDIVRRLREHAEATPGVSVPAERVWAGVRRRRQRRIAATSATTALAVTVVAVGASTGLPWTTTVPTEPANAAGWPAVTTPDRFAFGCGLPVPGIDDPPGDADLHLEPTAVPWPIGADAPSSGETVPLEGATLTQDDDTIWAINAVMVNGSDQTLEGSLHPQDPPVVWITRDGVVVGHIMTPVALIGGIPPEPVTWAPGDQVESRGHGRIDACEATGADRRLPPGDYEVYLTADVGTVPVEIPEPSQEDGSRLTADPLLTLAGGPHRVTLDEGQPPGDPWEDDIAAGRTPGLEDVPLGFDGLGPLRIGSPVPTDPAPTDMIRWEPAYCPDSPEPGRWIPNYSFATHPHPSGNQLPWFWITVRDEKVVRIDLRALVTTELINIGDPLTEVRAAYPDLTPLTTPQTENDLEAWAATDGQATMVFEIDPTTDRVVGIALLRGIDYDWPTADSHLCR